MKNIAWSSVIALTFVGACGADPSSSTSSSDVTAEDALRAGPTHKIAAFVTESIIVSDLPNVGARNDTPDANLVNAWGLAFNPSKPNGPAWVSENGTGLTEAFIPDGNAEITVTIPPPKGGMPPSAPTGQVFNDDGSAFGGDKFIFVTEDGTVSGWQPADGTDAVLHADLSKIGAVFKGVAIAESHGKKRLYAADFHNNRVVVFDDSFHPIHGHPFRFVDRDLPKGFAPFNIKEHDGLLFVSYAKQDDKKHDDVEGPGNGFVDVYEPDGDLVQRLISRGPLDSPWGMEFMAAGKKGCPRERLIVGNFGDGRINVFELEHFGLRRIDADLVGALGNKTTGKPLVIDGLWALVFGAGAFDPDDLYFTAGPGGEQHGLFGELSF